MEFKWQLITYKGDIIFQAATAYTNGDRAYAAYLSEQVNSLKITTEFCVENLPSLRWLTIIIFLCNSIFPSALSSLILLEYLLIFYFF